MKKKCCICGKEFTDRSKNQVKMTCSTVCRSKKSMQSDPERYLRRLLYMRFHALAMAGCNVSIEDEERAYEWVLDGTCQICKKHIEFNKLCIDHNHATNRVRGILCNKCNFLIGAASDNVEILLAAIKYLEASNAA